MKTRFPFSVPLVWEIVFFIGVIIGIPFAIIQLQQQQEIRSQATVPHWIVDQSATTSCPSNGSGVIITVTFSNSEPVSSSTAMNVKATDGQTGKFVNMTSIQGGQTRTGQIQTDRSTLSAGTVEFVLTWTDGHSGTDTRTAAYNAVSNCNPPSPTPTKTPTPILSTTPSPRPTKTPTPTPTIPPTPIPSRTPTPTQILTPTPTPTKTPTPKPSTIITPTKKITPTPTICPTLGPVKNVRIDCPNCP